MKPSFLSFKEVVKTPCFIFNKEKLIENLSFYKIFKKKSCFKLLYSLKSLSLIEALEIISEHVDGFSVSSLFEAKLAQKIKKKGQTIHFVSPRIKKEELDELTSLCHFISFNSLDQFLRFSKSTSSSIGLRINPDISFLKDERYDSCRKFSKLGESFENLKANFTNSNLKNVHGLHFHNNCESENFLELTETFSKIETQLKDMFINLKWLNLGGGYFVKNLRASAPLLELLSYLNKNYEFNIILEPGADIVRSAGFLVGSVIDLIKRDRKSIAILDTTVNHLPEVFEYQYEPDVLGHKKEAPYEYILAGCSCLSGDLFGSYQFEEPLKIGSQIIFQNVGSYSLVKAHMFNGINLPDIYLVEGSSFKHVKSFDFEDYLSQHGNR